MDFEMKHIKIFEHFSTSKINPEIKTWYIVPSYVYLVTNSEESVLIELIPGDLLLVHKIETYHDYDSERKYVTFTKNTNEEHYELPYSSFIIMFEYDINQQLLAKPTDFILNKLKPADFTARERKAFGNSSSGIKHFGKITREQAGIVKYERRGKLKGKQFGF